MRAVGQGALCMRAGGPLNDRQAHEVAAAALAANAGDVSVALSQLVARACSAGLDPRDTI